MVRLPYTGCAVSRLDADTVLLLNRKSKNFTRATAIILILHRGLLAGDIREPTTSDPWCSHGADGSRWYSKSLPTVCMPTPVHCRTLRFLSFDLPSPCLVDPGQPWKITSARSGPTLETEGTRPPS